MGRGTDYITSGIIASALIVLLREGNHLLDASHFEYLVPDMVQMIRYYLSWSETIIFSLIFAGLRFIIGVECDK